jgi:hypothetical protein
MAEFQGIYGGQDHEGYVRNVLYYQQVKPAPGVTRAELAEVVRRAMPQNEFFDQHEAYMAVFDANVPPRTSPACTTSCSPPERWPLVTGPRPFT